MASFFKKIFGKDNTEYTEKVTTQPIEETKLLLEELNDKEKEYVRNNLELATELLKELQINDEVHQFSPKCIDKAIESWFSDSLEQSIGVDINIYSNAMASAWGQYLADKLGMEWHVITDNYGTEIGLYHKINNTTIFPFNSTSKAFNNKSFDLISIITQSTKEILDQK
ncbi:MAG: DUF3806 domain-containing protein [Saprospiraceae bacterium]|nr:DUF3806 domain-containing protein [Saprospiraceae bacterium]